MTYLGGYQDQIQVNVPKAETKEELQGGWVETEDEGRMVVG